MKKRKKDIGIFETFLLRCTLFRIWFVKNLYLFITVGSLLVFILVITGNGVSIPFLGLLFTDMKHWNIDNSFVENILSVVGGLIAPMTAIAYIIRKVKHITLQDIKSNKTKLAMVKAGLYFNENGRLSKRSKDKKVVIKTLPEKKGLFGELIGIAKELKVAMTAKVENATVNAETIVDHDVGLKNLQDSLNNETIVESLSNIEPKPIEVIPDNVDIKDIKEVNIEEIKEDKEVVVPQVKKAKKNVFIYIIRWFIKMGEVIKRNASFRKERKAAKRLLKQEKKALKQKCKEAKKVAEKKKKGFKIWLKSIFKRKKKQITKDSKKIEKKIENIKNSFNEGFTTPEQNRPDAHKNAHNPAKQISYTNGIQRRRRM